MLNAYGIASTADLSIEPGTEQWYSYDAATCMAMAYEACHECPYAGNEHAYCHERSVLVGLLREIERLKAIS